MSECSGILIFEYDEKDSWNIKSVIVHCSSSRFAG